MQHKDASFEFMYRNKYIKEKQNAQLSKTRLIKYVTAHDSLKPT